MEKSTTVKVATLIEPTKAYDSKLTPLPVDDIPPTPLKVDTTFQMPLSTVYATINDRVGEKTIEGIIKLNEKGLSPSEIRAKGIGLTEQIIETIINDCASAPNTDTPSDASNIDDRTKHKIRKLYNNGHTIEYTASRTKTSIDDVNEIIEDINLLDISPNYATLAMVEVNKAASATAERIAASCGLRLDPIRLSLKGSR